MINPLTYSENGQATHRSRTDKINELVGEMNAPEDGFPYARLDGDWDRIDVLEAPSDGTAYLRKDGAWEQQRVIESIIDVETLSDFGTFTATTITLQSGTAYRIHGNVDIGDRTFTAAIGSNVVIYGEYAIQDKIISTSSQSLFNIDGCDLKLRDFAINAPNAALFNVTKSSGFSFIRVDSVDVDNINRFGTISDVNSFFWYGNSNITEIGNVQPKLNLVGSIDRVTIIGWSVNGWGGSLLDLSTSTVSIFRLIGNDFKFDTLNAKVFTDTTTNVNAISATVSSNTSRNHPDFPLSEPDFLSTVLASLGGITHDSSPNWHVSDYDFKPDTLLSFRGGVDVPFVQTFTAGVPVNVMNMIFQNGAWDLNNFVYDPVTYKIKYIGRKVINATLAFIFTANNDSVATGRFTFRLLVDSMYQTGGILSNRSLTFHEKSVVPFSDVVHIQIYPDDEITVEALSDRSVTVDIDGITLTGK